MEGGKKGRGVFLVLILLTTLFQRCFHFNVLWCVTISLSSSSSFSIQKSIFCACCGQSFVVCLSVACVVAVAFLTSLLDFRFYLKNRCACCGQSSVV